MRRSDSILVVAVSIALIAAGPFALPASAGSAEDPEITDAADDQKVQGQSDVQATFKSADILAAWVAGETDADFTLQLKAGQEIRGGSSNGQTTTHYTYTISGSVGETAFLAAAQVVNNPPEVTPVGDAESATAEGDILTIVVSKSIFGGVAPGTVLSGLYAGSSVQMRGTGPTIASDRAPDADFGREYIFSPGTATGDVNDTDGDLLNDTWEQDHFGNLTYNGTDDPDGDGCDNACELAAGTDPNNPDTDGDGVSDGDEIAAGTDPLDGGGSDGSGNTTSDGGNGTTSAPEQSQEDPDALAAPDDGGAGVDEAGAAKEDDKDSPGGGVVALLAALGVAFVVARRRR